MLKFTDEEGNDLSLAVAKQVTQQPLSVEPYETLTQMGIPLELAATLAERYKVHDEYEDQSFKI